jgi:3-deoxy-alpha-D-manno-octulosonate 8-oxidase
MNTPKDLKEFKNLKPWWRIPVPTDIVLSDDGIGDLFKKLKDEGKKPFFVIDEALAKQPAFAKVFEQKNVFGFNATFSEVRTSDVDALVAHIKTLEDRPDVMVGIGGGATMDLTKATSICLVNPKPAQFYQGYDMEMNKGMDIWVLPALNGTGAELTPIAVLRGPEKKLGINNKFVESAVAIIDPQLSAGAPKFNRFYTMMDCYYHHFEIEHSKTSKPDAILDAKDGCQLSREVLQNDLTDYDLGRAIKSAMASVLGGSSSIGGRVGASHAISYGLSNSAPKLPHSVAVTLSMLAMDDLYPDGYEETIGFLKASGMSLPKASEYGIGEKDIPKMVKTALGMEKLWASYFGDGWKEKATPEFMEKLYNKIVKA